MMLPAQAVNSRRVSFWLARKLLKTAELDKKQNRQFSD